MHDLSPAEIKLCCVLMQVAPQQSGSLVYKIDPLAPAHEVLKENDVVMQIDGVPIADDGTVEFRNEERVEFSHIVRAKHVGKASFVSVCHVKNQVVQTVSCLNPPSVTCGQVKYRTGESSCPSIIWKDI